MQHLLTSLLLLIVTARFLGELMVRLKQPRIIGEILAGIFLGPAFFNFVQPSENLEGIAQLSVFLIVLSAGLEMEFKDVITSVIKRGIPATFVDFLIPLGLGILVGTLFGLGALKSVFLGLCISITALPVTIRILEEFKLLNSAIARYTIATAILNDVAALLLLGVVLKIAETTPESSSILSVVASMLMTGIRFVIFAGIVFVASRILMWGGSQTRYIEKGIEKAIEFFGREVLFSFAILFVLFFASMSEQLGAHSVVGAFFGGLLLSKDVFGKSLFSELEKTLHSITAGFLAPIFFAYLGLHFGMSGLSNPLLLGGILAVSMGAKLIAGYIGARWSKMSKPESVGVGIILNGRGIMELIVADIAYQKGIIDQELFTILVIMGIVTTLLTPILFRKFVYPKLVPQGEPTNV